MTELAPQSKQGSYRRPKYTTNGRIGDATFPAEVGRYHVYVGNACPWCHRVLLTLAVRGLADSVTVTQLADDPERASRGGWVMAEPDPVFGAADLRQVYDAVSPGYQGRCTAPLLVDKVASRLVSNESADIIRMLNDLQLPGSSSVDLTPPHLQQEIEQLNAEVYDKVNNGVYKAGFATTQDAYDAAVGAVFDCLDALEQRLADNRFLLGDRVTEADLRLYPTIVRFDGSYYTLFKCSRRRIQDYPNLHAWMRDMHNLPLNGGAGLQIRDTFDVDDARRSYFSQLFPLNPGGIVPCGPTAQELGLDRPADRGPIHAEDVFFLRQDVAAVAGAAS